MGEAKRRRGFDPNYGKEKDRTLLSFSFSVLDTLIEGTYHGTATFDGDRFDLQWYGGTSRQETHLFKSISTCILPNARKIVRYFRNVKGMYVWEALITEKDFKISIKKPMAANLFRI